MKKGFTLIELLAVIVTLAIIVLIATPIVINVIGKSKKSAAEVSTENYIDIVEITSLMQWMKGKKLEGRYLIQKDGNLCPAVGCGENDADKITIDVNGNKPTDGRVTITNRQEISGILCIDGNKVKYDENGAEVIGTCGTEICWLLSETELEIGSEYECIVKEDGTKQIFYVLEDGDNTKLTPKTGGLANPGEVSLIMDRNLGNNVAWATKEDYIGAGGTESDYGTYGNNDLGPITAMNYLKEQTSSWEIKANLPNIKQIHQAAGYNMNRLPVWLYGNMQNSIGYWSSNPHSVNYWRAMSVYRGGSTSNNNVCYTGYGVRPVITISKTKLL